MRKMEASIAFVFAMGHTINRWHSSLFAGLVWVAQ